jgi:hypothetical protein
VSLWLSQALTAAASMSAINRRLSLNSEVADQAGLVAWGRHSRLPVGATFQSPEAGLESPANQAGWKACPTLFAVESQVLNFGIVPSSVSENPAGSCRLRIGGNPVSFQTQHEPESGLDSRPGLRSAGVTFFRGNDGSEWRRPGLWRHVG